MTIYVTKNVKSKKALKELIAIGEKLSVKSMSIHGEIIPDNAKNVAICGPHYPMPHKWYAQVNLENGYIVSVK